MDINSLIGLTALACITFFICAFRAYRSQQEVGNVKPEHAKRVMIGAVLVMLGIAGHFLMAPDLPSDYSKQEEQVPDK